MNELNVDDLPDLVVFAKVVESGGFTAASRSLEMSQATVSRRIARLEERIGVGLLDRTTRTVSITGPGKIFYRHAQRIVEEQNAVSAVLMGMSEQPSGRLRISAPVELGRSVLSPIIAEYRQRYPEVAVRIDLSQRRVDIIEEGFDVAIRVGPLENSTLAFRKLGHIVTRLYASPSYVERHGAPRYPEDLYDHPLSAAHLGGEPLRWRFTREENIFELKQETAIETNEYEILAELTNLDAGIAELPEFLGEGHVRAGKLVEVLSDFPLLDPPGDITAVFPAYRGMMMSLKTFLDLTEGRIGELMSPAAADSQGAPVGG